MTFDPANPPTVPDSSLDSYLPSAQTLQIQPDPNDGQMAQSIAQGDWVDVDPAVGLNDPQWGYSFQVINLYPNAVGVLYSSDGGQTYSETQVSEAGLTDNFRRVPRG
jgi:hypothetical protein